MSTPKVSKSQKTHQTWTCFYVSVLLRPHMAQASDLQRSLQELPRPSKGKWLLNHYCLRVGIEIEHPLTRKNLGQGIN